MGATLAEILESPQLPLYLEKIKEKMEAESRLREKFYEEMTEDGKWEFINGRAIMQSPASVVHSRVRARLARLLATWADANELGEVLDEKALISLARNDYEPDICFFGPEKAATLKPDAMRLPAPDLVVEVLSRSTEKTDRGIKFEDYAAHGVAEYWIIDPIAETVECYELSADQYVLRGDPSSYEVESIVIKGFKIPRFAIFHRGEHLKTLKSLLGE